MPRRRLLNQGFEREMDREMRLHIEALAERYIAAGIAPEEARRRAHAEFGPVELAKDEMRDLHPLRWLEQLWRDLRYAARQLRRAPAFAATVVLTLAVAIGANSAIFSVVRAVMLQPLPYPDAKRLVALWHSDRSDYTWYTFSFPRYEYFAQHLNDLAELGAYDDETATVVVNGEPLRVEGGRVSAGFFSTLGAKPALGRSFLPEEDRHGANAVMLLSDRFWRERLNADPQVLGRTFTVDGEPSTVIGVMPRDFQFLGAPVDVWRSRMVDTRTFAPASVRLGASYLTVVGRLRPGITLAQLQAKLSVVSDAYRADNPGNSDLTMPVNADFLQAKVFANVHLTILVLWGAVACLLAIACANVASLVLERAVAREREMRVRAALGASRTRIAQQLVLESLFLSIASIALSLPLSIWGTTEVVSALRRNSPAVPDVHPDAAAMGFLFLVASAVGILMGLVPLALLWRGNLRLGERGSSASMWSGRVRHAIAAGQVALCVILLAAAGLLAESLLRMSTMATGIQTDHVVLFPLDLMPDRYDSWERRVAFYEEAIRRADTIPGVTEAAVASRVDFVASGLAYEMRPEGSADFGARNPTVRGRSVSPGYFRTLGIPLLSGRAFDDHDTALSSRVAIVNEAFARKYFPGTNPIGRHVTYSTERIACEIVGVVANVRAAVASTGPDDQIYLPLAQRPWLVATLMLRAANPGDAMVAVRERIQSIDPEQAVAEAITMDRMIERRMGRPRTETIVVSVFAIAALFLAAIGVYGVVAYSVAQRRKDIGIRIALGASVHAIRALVFRQTFAILGAGLLIGVPGSVALGRLYASVLFVVKPSAPAILAGAAGVLLAVAVAATYFPARRATGIDPMSALRID